MREIKFRGWTPENNGFLDVSFRTGRDEPGDPSKALIQVRQFPLEVGTVLNPKVEVWEQYTGLKDKNGVGIYEGDILESEGSKGIVAWEDGKFVLRMGTDEGDDLWSVETYEWKEWGVIGNIHESPDLLTN